MVNLTDYYVGFRLFNRDEDAAVSYQANPKLGILAPRSPQILVVARVIKEKVPEGTQYNDKLFMWNYIVSEGIKVSDLDSDISLTRERTNEFPVIYIYT
jgi:galactose mutarotase-like enzyme